MVTLEDRCSRCGALREARRLDAHAAGFEAGYARGVETGAAAAREHVRPAAWLALLPDLVALCHPDRHPGRVEQSTRVTAALLALREAHGG